MDSKEQLATTQNTLPYLDLEQEGIMRLSETEYSKSYALGTVNYVTASHNEKENIFTSYFDAINSLSATEHFQLTMPFSKVTKKEFIAAHLIDLVGDDSDEVREDLNQLIEKKYDDGKNNYRIDRFITLATKNADRSRAISKLDNAQSSFVTELDKIGVGLREMDGLERMTRMSRILRPYSPVPKNFPRDDDSTKNWIAPQKMDFMSAFAQLDNGVVGQTLYVRNFPYELSDEFLKDICELGIEGVFNLHGTPYSFANSTKRIKNQKTNVGVALLPQQKRASQEGYSQEFVSPDLKEAWEDLDEQATYMRKTNSKEFKSSVLLYVYAPSKEKLIESLDKIKEVQEKHSVTFETLPYLQEVGLTSSLPLGKNYLEGIKYFTRGLITPNLAINIPWTSVELQHKKGKYFGINLLSKNIISIDRRGRTLQNSNGWIVGVSGSGKSVTTKFDILTSFYQNPDDEFIIIDPEREYLDIGEKVNAQRVTIAPKTKTNINIMDISKNNDVLDEEDDLIAIKADTLSAMFTNLLRDGLTEIQETIVDSVTTEAYQKYSEPTLTDWYGLLGDRVQEGHRRAEKTVNDIESEDLWSKLSLYVTGNYDIFAHKTNVNLNNRMVIYDVNQLTGKMKKFGYMAVIDQIQNRIIDAKKRGVKVWVYGDEIQTIIAPTSPPILREKFSDIWARIRKYGATVTGISQNINLILATPEGEAMFFNSEFYVLLRQKGKALQAIEKEFSLTPSLSQYLKKEEKGAGLVVAGDTIVPFNNPIPKDSLLFQIINTDAKRKSDAVKEV